MAKRSSVDVSFLLIGGYDCLGAITNFTENREAVLERSDVLGASWQEFQYAGLRGAELTQEGFYDDVANGVHEALSTGINQGSRILSYALEGTATGAEVMCWAGAQEINYERLVARGELHKARATYRTNGAVDNAKTVRFLNTAAAGGASTGTPLDNAASSTGGVGVLQVTSTTGITAAGMVVKLQDSADNITYADLMTFASATSTGPFADRQTTTAAIQRYVAASWSLTSGAGATPSVRFWTGLSRTPTSAPA